jgi:acyl dehydratase
MGRDNRGRISPMTVYQVGERFSREVTFDADSIRSFATLAGDHNPLHHDLAYASRSRFGGLIASGALLMGMVATHLSRGTMALGVEFSLRFRKAVRAGQTLRLEWTITAVEPEPRIGGDFVYLEGRMVDAGGITYVTASATCLVIPEAADPETL